MPIYSCRAALLRTPSLDDETSSRSTVLAGARSFDTLYLHGPAALASGHMEGVCLG